MIPKEFKVEEINYSNYLVDGELKTWNGPTANVYSSITNENNEPTLLGSIPDMSSDSALEAFRVCKKSF